MATPPTPASINKALGINQQKPPRKPAIAAPTQDPRSLQITVEQLKEAVETMQGQRGLDMLEAAVTWRDLVTLGLIPVSRVPSK